MKILTEITPELASVVAHICADGYVYKSKQRRTQKEVLQHKRKTLTRNIFGVVYTNTEPALVKEFTASVKCALGRKVVRANKCNYHVSGKWVWELLIFLGAGKSHEWFIAENIMNSNKQVKSAWLRSFFDDEAHVSEKNNQIIVNCVNLRGLQQIKLLLIEFKISSKI